MSAPCLGLDATGRKPAIPLRLVSGPEAVATKVRIRLESIRGSWSEDERIGLPWLDWQDAPNTAPVVIEGAIRRQLREVPGVLSVDRVTVTKAGSALGIAVYLTVDSGDTGPVRIAVLSTDDEANPGAWFVLLSHANPLFPG